MQDITRKQIENLSDEDLQSLLETCTEISTQRKYQKLYNERQVFCDLYADSWVKLKHRFDESDNFESQYMLVHIDKVQNIYNTSDSKDDVTIVAKYIEQYHVDILDKDDIDLRHIKVDSDLESVNTITFDTSDVIEFVKLEQVKKIVKEAIDKLKA